MKKLILISVFFTLLVSTEVVITALAAQAFGICMFDLGLDGEAEKDLDEKSEEDKKVEIQSYIFSEETETLSITLVQLERSIFSKPFLDQVTPPPEV